MDDAPTCPAPPGWRLAAAALVACSLTLLAAIATRTGSFFDDEIFTLNLIRRCPGAAALLACANAGDVHPPLGYLLDAASYGWLGSWPAVKLAKGAAMALSAGWLAWRAGSAMPRGAFVLLAALLALDGSLVMWTASLRWYGWFVPLYTLCLAEVLWSRRPALVVLALLTAGGVVLFHLNYLAVIAVPLLGLAWALRFARDLTPRRRWQAAAIVTAGLTACLPQAVVLVTVHAAYQGPQTGSLPMALAQTVVTVFPGNALFPLAPLPLLALAAVALAALAALHRRAPLPAALVLVLALGAALMVATGLGYRHRNSLFLHVTALPLVALVLAAIPRPLPRFAAIALVLAASAQGALNAARHEGTIKRSYNTPYPRLLATLERWSRSCPRLVVAHTDVVLGEALRGRAVQTGPAANAVLNLRAGDCLVLATGSAADNWAGQGAPWRAALAAVPARGAVVARFGPEPAAALAGRIIGHPVEDHAATLRLLRLTGPVRIPPFAPGPAASPRAGLLNLALGKREFPPYRPAPALPRRTLGHPVGE